MTILPMLALGCVIPSEAAFHAEGGISRETDELEEIPLRNTISFRVLRVSGSSG